MKIGVLALQGAVTEHIQMLSALDTKAVAVRLPSELDELDALVIPGGESTTISKLLTEYNLMEPIRELAKKGVPIFGTCAGLVLLAKKVPNLNLEPIGVMDIEVKRNAYGRQVNSFETDLKFPALGNGTFRGIFIRAPIIEKANSSVEVLCQLNKRPVAVKQGKLLACAFHPELTDDLRFHRYFLDLVTGDRSSTNPACHSEPFICHSEGVLRRCHSERSEESHTAQDKTPRPKNLTQGKRSEESGDPSLSLRVTKKRHTGDTVAKGNH